MHETAGHATLKSQPVKEAWSPLRTIDKSPIDRARLASHNYHSEKVGPETTTTTKTGKLVPINKNGERVDEFIPRLSTESWKLYNQRIGVHKLCTGHHIGGKCSIESCGYDHNPIEPPVLDVLRYLVRMIPCNHGPTCRREKCYLGHQCQRHNCKGYKPCRFRDYGHYSDREIMQWVPSVEQKQEKLLVAIDEGLLEPLIIL